MSEKTDEINSQWEGATSTWANPKTVTENTPISAKENYNQLTTLISRDIYVLDLTENNRTEIESSIDSLDSKITVVERTTNQLTETVGEIVANGGGTKVTEISEERIDEIWANA